MKHSTDKKLALSFDIEDWFTVRNMRGLIEEKQWHQQEYRVQVGLDYILDQLDKNQITATFFILGWIAEKSPELVKKIAQKGHEIGSHGYSHTPIDLMDERTFEDDLVKSLNVLEKISGQKIKGFRAPSFSITKKTSWALDILQKHHLKYDSSIFVTYHPDYGIQDFPTNITKLSNGLIVVPMKKSSVLGLKMPVCGGGYFRMLPYSIIKHSLMREELHEPTVLYFHPWEFDPDQPRVGLKGLKKFRHYVGLKNNREKFEKLLKDFHFTSIDQLICSQQEFKSYHFS